MLNALVLGWYGKGNAGDESYKLTLPRIFPNCDLTFTDSLSYYKDRADEFDILIVGGGDIFTIELVEQVKQFKATTPIRAVAFSISLIDNPDRCALDLFHKVYVRDKSAVENINHPNVHYLPDAAFMLEGNMVRGEEMLSRYFEIEKRDLYENRITVVVNSHLIAKPGEPSRKCAAFNHFSHQMAHVMDHTNASFFFLPFGTQMPWDDRCSEAYIASLCKFWKKNFVCFDRPAVQDCLDIIAASDIVLSTRLHSSIFSIANATPFVDIVHNHKNRSLLSDSGLEELSINYMGFDSNKLLKNLDDLLSDSSHLKAKIAMVKNTKQTMLVDYRERDVPLLQQTP